MKVKLEQLTATGTVSPDEITSSLPSKSTIDEAVGKLKTNLDTPASERIYDSELQMLERARDVEIETSNFYKQMAQELPEAGRKLFAPFVAIEEGHLAIVQAELDYVSGSGFYFDLFEVNLEHDR